MVGKLEGTNKKNIDRRRTRQKEKQEKGKEEEW